MEIVWDSRYDTGIRSIDLQHRELVDMINGLHKLPDDLQDSSAQTALFQRLNQYIVFHFGHEESLMGGSGVPLAHRRMHAMEHAAFSRELASRLDFANGVFNQAQRDALVEYLKNWLFDHILKTDVELARFVESGKRMEPGKPVFLLRGAGGFNLKS